MAAHAIRTRELAHQDLVDRLAPTSSKPVLAHERLLPVVDALVPLMAAPEESAHLPVGLTRGQTVLCTGSAAVSCALGLVAGVTQAGSWAAIVAMPSIGIQAAATMGVALSRTVFVADPESSKGSPRDGIEAVLSTLVDGMDLVVVPQRIATSLSTSLVRRLRSRMQSRGAVLVLVADTAAGDPGSTSVDIRFTARTVRWDGLGEGHGHLRRRLVSVEMDGRRCPRARVRTLWMPDPTGASAVVFEDEVLRSPECPSSAEAAVLAFPRFR